MKDECVKDESKVAEGKTRALIIRGWHIEAWSGLDHEAVDMMQGAEVELFCFEVKLSPEVGAVVGWGWGEIGEPLKGFFPGVGVGMAVNGFD